MSDSRRGILKLWSGALLGATAARTADAAAPGETPSLRADPPRSTRAGSVADVSFIQSGRGAILRTAQEKMRERVSLSDFGARLDGVSDDHVAWTYAVAATEEGGTLYIDGPFLFRRPIVLQKSINVICSGDDAYLKPETPGEDAFTFRAPSLRRVRMVLNMYGRAGACRNGVVLDKASESSFTVSAVVGATEYGVKTLGCLNSDIYIDISTNRGAPANSGAALPARSVLIGGSTDRVFGSCNASRFKVYIGGGGPGIEGLDARGEGNFHVEGTIEGNSGSAFSFTGNKGLHISNLHCESGRSSPSVLTRCTNLHIGPSVENVGATVANTTLAVVQCSAFRIDGYTGSLTIDAASRHGELGVISLNAHDSIVNLSSSVQQASSLNALAGSNGAFGHVGEYNQENIFCNPFVDIWPNGPSAAPAGFDGGSAAAPVRWAAETGVSYAGTPGGRSRKAAQVSFERARPSLADSAAAQPTGIYGYFDEETWIACMTAVYVGRDEPAVDVYIFTGGSYYGIGQARGSGAWTALRGAVRLPAGIRPAIVFRPAGPGKFLIGGLSIVRGSNPPKHICNHGRREEYVVDNVGHPPAFTGQRAYVSRTRRWYFAAAAQNAADWISLN